MELNKLEKTVSYTRFISIIAVIASGFGSLLMYIIGAVKVVVPIKVIFILIRPTMPPHRLWRISQLPI